MTTMAVAAGRLAGPDSPCYSINVSAPPWLQPGGASPVCHTVRPETFFPRTYGLAYKDQIAEAKALCNACPLQDLCLEWALPKPDLDGIWAATTPPERRRLRRARRGTI